MKRAPTWDERMLVHAILSTGECQCCALTPDNFNPFAMAQLRESLPKIPGLSGWKITRTETTGTPGMIEFGVSTGGAGTSQNKATYVGDTIVLKTLRFAPAGGLSAEADTLADVEECAAVALLYRGRL